MVVGAIVVEVVDQRWINRMVSFFAATASIAFLLQKKGID